MSPLRFRAASAAIVTMVVLAGGPLAAQDVDRIRTLYVAAAYEEALAAMPLADEGSAEIEQFRALCQLALGREGDARGTLERLVKANPLFQPSGDELSPRMLGLVAAVRAGILPDLARAAYRTAKVAYEARRDGEAAAGFTRAVDLIDSLPEADRGALTDIRLLASEFKELAAGRAATTAPDRAENTKPASPPAPARAAPYVGPVAISEQLPQWNPPDLVAARSEYQGLLRVQIGADGQVTGAAIVQPSHPAYDVLVVQAARRWRYAAATRGGEPVPSQKEIRIRLVPR